jgi:signal transduction histidine kinase
MSCVHVESLRVLAEEKQQRIEVSTTPGVWADVDLTMVRQALLNVIHNSKALLCSQGGGIELRSVPGAGCCFLLTLPLAAQRHR